MHCSPGRNYIQIYLLQRRFYHPVRVLSYIVDMPLICQIRIGLFEFSGVTEFIAVDTYRSKLFVYRTDLFIINTVVGKIMQRYGIEPLELTGLLPRDRIDFGQGSDLRFDVGCILQSNQVRLTGDIISSFNRQFTQLFRFELCVPVASCQH